MLKLNEIVASCYHLRTSSFRPCSHSMWQQHRNFVNRKVDWMELYMHCISSEEGIYVHQLYNMNAYCMKREYVVVRNDWMLLKLHLHILTMNRRLYVWLDSFQILLLLLLSLCVHETDVLSFITKSCGTQY